MLTTIQPLAGIYKGQGGSQVLMCVRSMVRENGQTTNRLLRLPLAMTQTPGNPRQTCLLGRHNNSCLSGSNVSRVHGTEEGSDCHQSHETTPGNVHN